MISAPEDQHAHMQGSDYHDGTTPCALCGINDGFLEPLSKQAPTNVNSAADVCGTFAPQASCFLGQFGGELCSIRFLQLPNPTDALRRKLQAGLGDGVRQSGLNILARPCPGAL